MRPFQFLNRLNKAQKTLILGVTLSGLMLLVAVFSKEGFMTVRDFEGELQALILSNQKLDQENERLRGQIQALKTDPFEIERIARDKLNFVKPGEVVYQIVPPPAPESSSPP